VLSIYLKKGTERMGERTSKSVEISVEFNDYLSWKSGRNRDVMAAANADWARCAGM
jgi:hypothetical protein